MRKSRNIKVKLMNSDQSSQSRLRWGAYLTLGLMLAMTACPLSSLGTEEAQAWGGAIDGGDLHDSTAYDDNGSGGGGTKPVNSTVSISFSPTAGEASMTPVTTAGTSARTMVLATVDVQNSGGYSVYLKSNSQNLTGRTSKQTISPITGNVTYSNLAANTWGYASAEGTTVADNATYSSVSTSGNGNLIGENTSSNITNESKTFALSFAAKIGSDKPADTYENQIILSVVSAPGQVAAFGGIQTMQAMTTSICDAAEVGDEVQLRDTRDGKMYWVSKLVDGKCWMTQNLDLDLSTSKYLSPSDSDVVANWMPAYSTATQATSSTILASHTGQRSWSLGDYRITNPIISSSCGSGKNSAAGCPGHFTAYTTPTFVNGDINAHYILGNHYQWNAATAGTGGSITSGIASSSICPKGWRLPTSGTGGEFEKLVTALGGTSSTNNVTQAPFYGVRGGFIWQNDDFFDAAGDDGCYWSSTPYPNDGANAYSLSFRSTNFLRPSSANGRAAGFSIRCVAR